jgi:hypothetical protein
MTAYGQRIPVYVLYDSLYGLRIHVYMTAYTCIHVVLLTVAGLSSPPAPVIGLPVPVIHKWLLVISHSNIHDKQR